MTDTVSAFAQPFKLKTLDQLGGTVSSGLAATNFSPQYQSSFINYNSPVSLADSNNLDLFKNLDVPAAPKKLGLDVGNPAGETPWYQDGQAMQGYAGLASAFAQLTSLPGQLKLAKLQRQGLQQNITQQKVDNNFRAGVRSNLNSHRMGA